MLKRMIRVLMEGTIMESDLNKAVIQQFFEASSGGDIPQMVSLWAPNAVNHGRFTEGAPTQALPPSGLAGLDAVFGSLYAAFPDRQWHIDQLIAAGDLVIARLTVSGTHQGVPRIPVEGGPLLQAIQPIGKHYAVQHIHIFKLADGKITEHWAARDDLGLIEQLGGLPHPNYDDLKAAHPA